MRGNLLQNITRNITWFFDENITGNSRSEPSHRAGRRRRTQMPIDNQFTLILCNFSPTSNTIIKICHDTLIITSSNLLIFPALFYLFFPGYQPSNLTLDICTTSWLSSDTHPLRSQKTIKCIPTKRKVLDKSLILERLSKTFLLLPNQRFVSTQTNRGALRMRIRA